MFNTEYVIDYIQHSKNPMDYYKLDVKALKNKNQQRICDRLEEEDRQVIDQEFGETPEKLKGEYLDVYEGDRSEIYVYYKAR